MTSNLRCPWLGRESSRETARLYSYAVSLEDSRPSHGHLKLLLSWLNHLNFVIFGKVFQWFLFFFDLKKSQKNIFLLQNFTRIPKIILRKSCGQVKDAKNKNVFFAQMSQIRFHSHPDWWNLCTADSGPNGMSWRCGPSQAYRYVCHVRFWF